MEKRQASNRSYVIYLYFSWPSYQLLPPFQHIGLILHTLHINQGGPNYVLDNILMLHACPLTPSCIG